MIDSSSSNNLVARELDRAEAQSNLNPPSLTAKPRHAAGFA
jgi:hypothetical protein